MPAFQTTVVIIAAVLLVIFLLVVAYGVQEAVAHAQWPPELATCPDYWQDAGNGICNNTLGLGTCGDRQYDVNSFAPGKAGMRDRCTWAEGCNLTWDGITDVGSCDSLTA